MPPISVTSDQYITIMSCAYALQPWERAAFLQSVADRLNVETTLGDGVIGRVLRDIQAGFPHPTPPNIEVGWNLTSQRPRKLVDAPALGPDDEVRAARHRQGAWHGLRTIVGRS